jgi:glycerate 2-kinase
VPPHLPPDDGGRLIVIGAGKASAAMARAVEDHWPGPLDGLVVTRYGHGVPCRASRSSRRRTRCRMRRREARRAHFGQAAGLTATTSCWR